MDTAMTSFFTAESACAFMKPWLRLERGLRLGRFRVFAEEYPDLTVEEREVLWKSLSRFNDAKLLNTKQQIQYEEGRIVGIRGLKLLRSDGCATFKIETRPTKRTKGTKEEVDIGEKIDTLGNE